MNIQQIRYLVALADHETLTAAANALGVSQPVVSRALHELEDELKTVLFKRAGRRLIFTKRGEEVLATSRRAVMAFDDVSRLAGPNDDWTLRIGICHASLVQLLPILEVVLKKYPRLRVKAPYVCGSEEMLQLLREGAIDVGFGVECKPGPGIAFTSHETAELVLVSPVGTQLPKEVSFSDLEGLPFICQLPSMERTLLLDNVCTELGFRMNYVLECDDPTVFMDAVRSGIGSSFGWLKHPEPYAGLESRRFSPRHILPLGFYHTNKPPLQVRSLLSFARQHLPNLETQTKRSNLSVVRKEA
jgi:LysR family transcriptional regulator, cyn operon transcriptional activator